MLVHIHYIEIELNYFLSIRDQKIVVLRIMYLYFMYRAETLASEIKDLQGELGDYNTVSTLQL